MTRKILRRLPIEAILEGDSRLGGEFSNVVRLMAT